MWWIQFVACGVQPSPTAEDLPAAPDPVVARPPAPDPPTFPSRDEIAPRAVLPPPDTAILAMGMGIACVRAGDVVPCDCATCEAGGGDCASCTTRWLITEAGLEADTITIDVSAGTTVLRADTDCGEMTPIPASADAPTPPTWDFPPRPIRNGLREPEVLKAALQGAPLDVDVLGQAYVLDLDGDGDDDVLALGLPWSGPFAAVVRDGTIETLIQDRPVPRPPGEEDPQVPDVGFRFGAVTDVDLDGHLELLILVEAEVQRIELWTPSGPSWRKRSEVECAP